MKIHATHKFHTGPWGDASCLRCESSVRNEISGLILPIAGPDPSKPCPELKVTTEKISNRLIKVFANGEFIGTVEKETKTSGRSLRGGRAVVSHSYRNVWMARNANGKRGFSYETKSDAIKSLTGED